MGSVSGIYDGGRDYCDDSHPQFAMACAEKDSANSATAGRTINTVTEKVATFPPLQTLQVTTLADKHRQEVTTSVQALWSAGKSVKVTRWQMTTSPGELELQLQWEDLISVFTHLATLAQPCVPDEFTLNRGQDVLILRLRLCADD